MGEIKFGVSKNRWELSLSVFWQKNAEEKETNGSQRKEVEESTF